MYLSSDQLLPQLLVVCGLLYLLTLYAAVRYAPWQKLMVRENSNTYFAALVGILFFWMLGTEIEAGAVFHLSAMTSLTLMVGWQFAIIGGSFVLAGLILTQQGEWLAFLPSSLVSILVPVMMTWFLLVLVLVRSLLPKHFFIYIFFNAFFTGAIIHDERRSCHDKPVVAVGRTVRVIVEWFCYLDSADAVSRGCIEWLDYDSAGWIKAGVGFNFQ
ncbi:hypothetical protein [Solemya elarraichensis gill symbiont]|uniref:Uncharacterized protein n=1 Tax=Solemya elarraichensis gill symbiont TaxID=1918949 RepID=A0A1T2L5P4_9GAMM|nr:hypothetical protein [Solemya elarraichensis gill symbiont]OOZ40427.1 hypothetical protein BOW52_05890 [Solemya elarraichensis gill symbiont]